MNYSFYPKCTINDLVNNSKERCCNGKKINYSTTCMCIFISFLRRWWFSKRSSENWSRQHSGYI